MSAVEAFTVELTADASRFQAAMERLAQATRRASAQLARLKHKAEARRIASRIVDESLAHLAATHEDAAVREACEADLHARYALWADALIFQASLPAGLR